MTAIASVKRTSPFFEPENKHPKPEDLTLLREKVQSLQPLLILDKMKECPVNYVASFYHLVERRCQYATKLFAAIIRSKDAEPPSLTLTEPTLKLFESGELTTRQKTRRSLEDLLKAVDKLFNRMEEFQTLLDFSKTSEVFNKLNNCEFENQKHYQNKLPEVAELEAPEYVEVIVEEPRPQIFDRIARIKDHELYGEEEVQNILAPLLDNSQKVYNCFRKASFGLKAFYKLFHHYQMLHAINLGSIHAIKNRRPYHSERHAQTHIKKILARALEQQKLFYIKENHLWGQKLSTPSFFTPEEQKCCNYPYVFCAEKGDKRTYMEDRSVIATLTFIVKSKPIKIPLFAILDGHGGSQAAAHCQWFLKSYLREALSDYNKEEFTLQGFCNAARATCLRLHDTFMENSGTTLLFVTIIEGFLYTVSVGDSRALLINDTVLPLNYESNTRELYFQEKARRYGAEVSFSHNSWRIKGSLGLNVASTLGDKLDTQYLTQVPTITRVPLPQKSTLVLCSDGLSSVASDIQIQEVVNTSPSLTDAAKTLMYKALLSSTDNISLIAVQLP